jgi:hypothetical protein
MWCKPTGDCAQSGLASIGLTNQAARGGALTDHERVQQLLRIKEQAPAGFDQPASALIVVDVQRQFARPEYPFGEVLNRLVPGLAAG